MINQSVVTRVEKKYEINAFTAMNLKSILCKTLIQDSHNTNDGYMVRSLYFDTFYNNDYFDKENGLEYRRKIRLRTYDPRSQFLKLELKQKEGDYQHKYSLTIPKNMAQRLLDGHYEVLKELNNDFADKLYTIMQTNLYRPKCIVEYKRLAYIVKENNTRITIDSDLKSSESNMDIFNPLLPLNTVTSKTILEVKYNNFLLSYVKDIIDNTNKSQTSASKYCMSRYISYL